MASGAGAEPRTRRTAQRWEREVEATHPSFDVPRPPVLGRVASGLSPRLPPLMSYLAPST